MRKRFSKIMICYISSFAIASSALAANVTLYSLDNRTLDVDESQVELYTKEGMGWFTEKPVTMYASDGRTIVIPADKVEAYENVGWFLKENLPSSEKPVTQDNNQNVIQQQTQQQKTIKIKYTDGTTVSVPNEHLEMYKALGWVEVTQTTSDEKVIMYNSQGEKKEVNADEVSKYESAGWSRTEPVGEYIQVYLYDGKTKNILSTQLEEYKKQGWYKAYDEAVYSYAAFGNGSDVLGATTLLENKKYEQAFNMVQDAISKIENTDSEYVPMLYYLRTVVTDTWREAAKSPLGFVNYWFSEKDGKSLVVFEYRNISNSRIQSFRINFDVCNNSGEVVEVNSGSYYVNNLEMPPCEKKRVAWVIKQGDIAHSIKNLKVTEVVFSDGTKWTPTK